MMYIARILWVSEESYKSIKLEMGANLILLAEKRQKSRDLFFSWGFCVPEIYSWMRVVAVPFTWLLSNLCSRYTIRSGTFVVNGSEWKRKSSLKAIHPQSGLIHTKDVFSTTCKTFSNLKEFNTHRLFWHSNFSPLFFFPQEERQLKILVPSSQM